MDAVSKRTIAEIALGYKKPIDRTDRFQIDAKRLLMLLEEHSFFDVIDELRASLGIKELSLSIDLNRSKPIILYKHRYGVNSQSFLRMDEITKEKIEKLVYQKVLKRFGLSFNFYPFVEWYLFYRDLMPVDLIPEPNPNVYELYKKYPHEFIRNTHTSSDIKYMLQQCKIKLGLFDKRITRTDRALLNAVQAAMSFNKNTERRPKEWKSLLNDLRILSKVNKPYKYGRNNIASIRDIVTDEMLKTSDWPKEKEIQKNRDRLKRTFSRMRKQGFLKLKK